MDWKGDWSNDSTKWTPEIVKLLNFEKKDKGSFWISLKDYCE